MTDDGLITAAIKVTPALAGTLATTLTANLWVAIATGVYVIVQTIYLVRKFHREEADAQREIELHEARMNKLQESEDCSL